MGLEKGDAVIKRRLTQRLQLLAQNLITPEKPSEDELRAWFEENEKEFTQPDRYSLVHLYFNPDKRGSATADDAMVELAKLQSTKEIPMDIASRGDRLLPQIYYEDQTETALWRSGYYGRLCEREHSRITLRCNGPQGGLCNHRR